MTGPVGGAVALGKFCGALGHDLNFPRCIQKFGNTLAVVLGD